MLFEPIKLIDNISNQNSNKSMVVWIKFDKFLEVIEVFEIVFAWDASGRLDG